MRKQTRINWIDRELCATSFTLICLGLAYHICRHTSHMDVNLGSNQYKNNTAVIPIMDHTKQTPALTRTQIDRPYLDLPITLKSPHHLHHELLSRHHSGGDLHLHHRASSIAHLRRVHHGGVRFLVECYRHPCDTPASCCQAWPQQERSARGTTLVH